MRPVCLPMDNPSRHLVVVAEDDPLLRLDACMTLEAEGFDVIEAPDAPTALALIEEHAEVKALFTDVQMPGPFSGLVLAWRACDIRPWLKVFVASGEARISPDDLPCQGRFFSKPYEMSAVARALRAAVAA